MNEKKGANVGVTLGPSHTKAKGQVFRQQNMVNEKLAAANMNIDRMWTLQFNAHQSSLDERPLMHMGRVFLPMATDFKNCTWRKSDVVARNALVGPVDAPNPADMQIIEDLSETALPSSSDPNSHITQAERACLIECVS